MTSTLSPTSTQDPATAAVKYFLTDWSAGEPVDPGTALSMTAVDPHACTSPRLLDPEESGAPIATGDWINQANTTRLYRLVPIVDGVPVDTLAEGQRTEQWLVIEELAAGLVLGPQATEIYRAAANLAPLFDPHHPGRRARSDDEWSNLHEKYCGLNLHRDEKALAGLSAAVLALNDAGDRKRWPCLRFREYAALAARDLIGTVPNWTRAAYDDVMSGYRSVFGHESRGHELIAAERQRQVEDKGYTAERDAAYGPGVLSSAAAAYMHLPSHDEDQDHGRAHGYWPFHPGAFKPSGDRTRDLAKAGALIAAEIDAELNRKARGRGAH